VWERGEQLLLQRSLASTALISPTSAGFKNKTSVQFCSPEEIAASYSCLHRDSTISFFPCQRWARRRGRRLPSFRSTSATTAASSPRLFCIVSGRQFMPLMLLLLKYSCPILATCSRDLSDLLSAGGEATTIDEAPPAAAGIRAVQAPEIHLQEAPAPPQQAAAATPMVELRRLVRVAALQAPVAVLQPEPHCRSFSPGAPIRWLFPCPAVLR
jgi:hypothetical protein